MAWAAQVGAVFQERCWPVAQLPPTWTIPRARKPPGFIEWCSSRDSPDARSAAFTRVNAASPSDMATPLENREPQGHSTMKRHEGRAQFRSAAFTSLRHATSQRSKNLEPQSPHTSPNIALLRSLPPCWVSSDRHCAPLGIELGRRERRFGLWRFSPVLRSLHRGATEPPTTHA